MSLIGASPPERPREQSAPPFWRAMPLRSLVRRLALLLASASLARSVALDKCGACFIVYDSLLNVLRLEHLDEDKVRSSRVR